MGTALPTGLTEGTWTIDPTHSDANFIVRHAGIAKVRGSIGITAGEIKVGADLEHSSVNATLDPSTVSTGNSQRDAHLVSADFFEVEKFPTWTFSSTSVTTDGEDYEVHGDLTIHGVTQTVTLEVEFGGVAEDASGATRMGLSATTEFSRKDFGLTWNQALAAGGVLVSDKVKIEIDISAISA